MIFKTIIPTVTVILLILGWLFGDDIVNKIFKEENLIYQTHKTKIPAPDKNANCKKCSESIDTYREIIISNTGNIPATKLNLTIYIDGTIKDFQVKYADSHRAFKETDNIIKIQMARLVPNIDIKINVWFKHTNAKFDIQAIHNKNGKISKRKIPSCNIISYGIAICALSLLLTTLGLYFFVIAPKNKEITEAKAQVINLQGENSELTQKNEELEQLTDDDSNTEIADDMLQVHERLGKIVEKIKNKDKG